MIRRRLAYRDGKVLQAGALRFFEGMKLHEIQAELGLSHPYIASRMVHESVRRGMFRGFPPVETLLQEAISTKYGMAPGNVRVVDVCVPTDEHEFVRSNPRAKSMDDFVMPAPSAAEWVSTSAAGLAFDVLREKGPAFWAKQEAFQVGIGDGRAAMHFSLAFSTYLRTRIGDENKGLSLTAHEANRDDTYEPHSHNFHQIKRSVLGEVRIVPLSNGCPAHEPSASTTSFFGYFGGITNVEPIRMKTPTYVTQAELASGRIQKSADARHVFDLSDKTQMVITSLGDFKDKHDMYAGSLRDWKAKLSRTFRSSIVGNMQFRAYSERGALLERPNDLRVVSLYELSDYRRMVSEGKVVILIARTCSMCPMNRARALLPLLTCDALRVFNYLVLDVPTAEALLD